jgi:hypothetical protein
MAQTSKQGLTNLETQWVEELSIARWTSTPLPSGDVEAAVGIALLGGWVPQLRDLRARRQDFARLSRSPHQLPGTSHLGDCERPNDSGLLDFQVEVTLVDGSLIDS